MMEGLLSLNSATASLPPLLLVQGWLSLGWGLVVAALALGLFQRWVVSKAVAIVLTLTVAVWIATPGVWGGHYWLGLAFQAPSVLTVMLSTVWLVQRLRLPRVKPSDKTYDSGPSRTLVALGVLLGWALLLDTLGVFPASLYNWGFGAVAPAVALVVAASPWVYKGSRRPDAASIAAVFAVIFFVVLQLPTGNVFDALLDPGLWIFLQILLLKMMREGQR